MAMRSKAEVTRLAFSVRFVQGYRYLDRCGEAVIRLEDTLGEGWIPGSISPQDGSMSNYRLGMTANFSSERIATSQAEFISFNHFQDQTCKVFEVLCAEFGVKRVFAPSFQATLQTGFDTREQAEEYIRGLKLCSPEPSLLEWMDGPMSAMSFTVCTERDVLWQDVTVKRRRRWNLAGIRQEKQPTFDTRILLRVPLLPARHHEALRDLLELRRRHPDTPSVAAQFELENSFESEFSSKMFDLAEFLDNTWRWFKSVQECLKTK